MIMKSNSKKLVFSLIFSSLLIAGCSSNQENNPVEKVSTASISKDFSNLTVHYQRGNSDYDNFTIWAWDDVDFTGDWPHGIKYSGIDNYGAVYSLPLKPNPKKASFLFVDETDGDNGKDGSDKIIDVTKTNGSVWAMQGSDVVYYSEPDPIEDNEIRVHYKRDDGNYDNFTVWAWNDADFTGDWPHGIKYSGIDNYGAYYDIPLKTNRDEANNLGFLLVDETQGDPGKDGSDKAFTKLAKYKEIFVVQGSDDVFIGPNMETPDGLEAADIIDDNKISLKFTNTEDINEENLILKNKYSISTDIKDIKIIDNKKVVITADLRKDWYPYTIEYEGFKITLKPGLAYFDSKFSYTDDDLGAIFNSDGSITLKVWAPTSEDVQVAIFKKSNPEIEAETIPMNLTEKGVWAVTLSSDYKGDFYQYKLKHQGEKKYTYALDPYAKSMYEFKINTNASNRAITDAIGKGALVNPSEIAQISSFAHIDGYTKREDAIIYEMHVRDFTSHIDANTSAQFGTYKAFIEKLDYLKSLGVTHIQLLPVQSFYYGDESKNSEREWNYSAKNNNYNWGYDPHSYFAPEGMYSENPKDPALRIKELKELIQAIHDKGMGVTLDVVYNHTANSEIFERLVPGYYGFLNADGTPKTSFGGLQMGTTHAMTRKLIIDSIKYWTKEFKVDGFRFDMMGNLDAKTVQMAYNEAAKLNPNTLFIGEGWRTFNGDAGVTGIVPADQDWMNKTDDVAVFSDEIRNELKSGFGSEGEPRFITGGERNINTIFNNIKGQPSNFNADDPGDVVQYIAAHDNLPLHDVISQSIRKSVATHEDEIQKRIRLGNTIILTSQGIAFLHGGQEYGRTKQWKGTGKPEDKYTVVPQTKEIFIHDSYDSSDRINAFDWTAVEKNGRGYLTKEYTKGLIAIRRSTDAFRLGSKDLVDSNVSLLYPNANKSAKMIAYKATATNGDEYYVFINGYANGETPRDSSLKAGVFELNEDLSTGLVLADNDEANVNGVNEISGVTFDGNKVILDPLTAVIIKK
ncbi:type I pullulanase [Hypnocyclicus thermotrophus]|uniref:pullulanase n=1 Tax=Hypnocyclicus thermotrophus TaxID=1627895 RepID=A0AA46DXI6_9FUSO|nr:pullulanase [Hypnocyclicus thermotrophus]TDT68096.1 type I pullulanase [Hypnocyclicus thermotrophus]